MSNVESWKFAHKLIWGKMLVNSEVLRTSQELVMSPDCSAFQLLAQQMETFWG